MLDNLETRIVTVLDGVAKNDRTEGGLSNKLWTQQIKEGLCALGKVLGYGVSAAGCKGAHTGEWMFDLMWAGGDKDHFQEMPLAMECEWSTDIDQIFWDFEKLLIAKAPHKLFVFQQGADNEVEHVAKELTAAVHRFRTKLPEERYLIAGWSSERKGFIYHVALG